MKQTEAISSTYRLQYGLQRDGRALSAETLSVITFKIMLQTYSDVVGVDIAVWSCLLLWVPQDHPALRV